MKNQDDLIHELVWARQGLRIFIELEKIIRSHLGAYGIEKRFLKRRSILFLLGSTFTVSIAGILFYFLERNPSSILFSIPFLVSIGVVANGIRKEKKRNIFRILSQLPEYQHDFNLMERVRYFVFKNRDQIEDIISWKVSRMTTGDAEKFSYLFDGRYWGTRSSEQKQCMVLAVLMVSLQKFMYKHRKIYDEHVKQIPLINEEYSKSKIKISAPLNEADIQTWGG